MNDKNYYPYQQCKKCVMDISAKDIIFDDDGVCNYCKEFIKRSGHIINESKGSKQERLKLLVEKVKKSGIGKRYDCIVGVSGGVDSSWTLVEVKRLGLRPLAVHLDNGWNSELAQNNIENLVTSLGVDLYTHVIEWEEYRALMQAFFNADVIDIELLYDNAMLAINYKLASQYKLEFILSGSNQATEGMNIPKSWNWFKFDKLNIQKIAKINDIYKFKTFPSVGTYEYIFYSIIKRIRWISFPDFIHYDKFSAIETLKRDYGYKPYPYKHYESIFTRLYQGYILPNKFGIDKRKVHLSTLVISGQLSRDAALEGLSGIAYPNVNVLNEDIAYFLKKMKWSSNEFQEYIKRPEIMHDKYRSEKWVYDFLFKIAKKIPKNFGKFLFPQK